MSAIHFIGHTFNGLEFVTYILIPSSILLVILVYVFFNIRLLSLSAGINDDVMDQVDLWMSQPSLSKVLDLC